MSFTDLYSVVKQKRSHPNLPVFWWRRQPKEQWDVTRKHIHERDNGVCQSPIDAPPKRQGLCQWQISLRDCHIDHIKPLSSGGSNHASNLRTLCPVCHALRVDRKHESMKGNAVKNGLLPVDWKQFVWD